MSTSLTPTPGGLSSTGSGHRTRNTYNTPINVIYPLHPPRKKSNAGKIVLAILLLFVLGIAYIITHGEEHSITLHDGDAPIQIPVVKGKLYCNHITPKGQYYWYRYGTDYMHCTPWLKGYKSVNSPFHMQPEDTFLEIKADVGDEVTVHSKYKFTPNGE